MRKSIRIMLLIVAIAFMASTVHAAEPVHKYFTASDGVKIHYMTLGDKGSWVVLIHGYMDSAERMWFSTGVAQGLSEKHRIVAIDNRNHGKSDKPVPRGSGKMEDVVELMDLLKIDRAHIHGYSMGGGITGRLLATIPDRFITAAFGGSGIMETSRELREIAAAYDKPAPAPQGAEAVAFTALRNAISSRRVNPGAEGEERPRSIRQRSSIDLSKVTIPVLAINGGYDRPYAKTHRMWRELINFQNVILPGKSHITAIFRPSMPKEYLQSLSRFIDANDL